MSGPAARGRFRARVRTEVCAFTVSRSGDISSISPACDGIRPPTIFRPMLPPTRWLRRCSAALRRIVRGPHEPSPERTKRNAHRRCERRSSAIARSNDWTAFEVSPLRPARSPGPPSRALRTRPPFSSASATCSSACAFAAAISPRRSCVVAVRCSTPIRVTLGPILRASPSARSISARAASGRPSAQRARPKSQKQRKVLPNFVESGRLAPRDRKAHRAIEMALAFREIAVNDQGNANASDARA